MPDRAKLVNVATIFTLCVGIGFALGLPLPTSSMGFYHGSLFGSMIGLAVALLLIRALLYKPGARHSLQAQLLHHTGAALLFIVIGTYFRAAPFFDDERHLFYGATLQSVGLGFSIAGNLETGEIKVLDSFPDSGWKSLGNGRYERVEVRSFVSPWPLPGLVFATEFEHKYTFTPYRDAPPFDNVRERSAALVSARLLGHAKDFPVPLFAEIEPHRLGERVWLVSWGAIKTFCVELIGLVCYLAAVLPIVRAFREIRSHRRIAQGRCGWCGYPQTPPSTVCPECGRSLSPAVDRRARDPFTPSHPPASAPPPP